MPLIPRRAFLTGILSTLAAPAVVRATSIMPVKALPLNWLDEAYRITKAELDDRLYGNYVWSDLIVMTRQAFVPRLFVQMYDANPTLAALMEPLP
jgi:hypothetical protein